MFKNTQQLLDSHSPYQDYSLFLHFALFSLTLPWAIVASPTVLLGTTSLWMMDLIFNGKLSRYFIDKTMKFHLKISFSDKLDSENCILGCKEERSFLSFNIYSHLYPSTKDANYQVEIDYPINDDTLLTLLKDKLNEWNIEGDKEKIATHLLSKIKSHNPILEKQSQISFQHYLNLSKALFKDICSLKKSSLHLPIDPLLYRSPTRLGNVGRSVLALLFFLSTLNLAGALAPATLLGFSFALTTAFCAGALGFTLFSYSLAMSLYGYNRVFAPLKKNQDDEIEISYYAGEYSGSRGFGIGTPYETSLSDLKQNFINQLNHLLKKPENMPPQKHQKHVDVLATYFSKLTSKTMNIQDEQIKSVEWDEAHVEDKVKVYQQKGYFKVKNCPK